MAKPKTYDEALAHLESLKEIAKEKREALRTFKTENNVKRNKPIEDEKLAAKLEKLEAAADKAKEAVEDAKSDAKELKPKKERAVKYEYPEDCITDKDKKKYRAKMRRESKKGDAGDETAETKVPKKKSVKKPVVKDETSEED